MQENKNTYFYNGEEREDRRQFPRLATTVDVQYNLIKEYAPKTEVLAKNIGTGGICLIVYEKVLPGSLLDLQIHISDINHKIQAKGKVIWVNPFSVGREEQERYDVGIEFVEIAEADKKQLSEYVFRLS